MGIFIKGEVVILPFPFSDLKTEKFRPALILSVPRSDELIVCQITKQNTRPEYTILLVANDFLNGHLKVDSFIRPDHIFTADPSIVKYSAGKLKPEKVEEVIEETIRILKEK